MRTFGSIFRLLSKIDVPTTVFACSSLPRADVRRLPDASLHPMRAIFLIPTKPPPHFTEEDKWCVGYWRLHEIVLLWSCCAWINHPFLPPARLHCPPWCNTIAQLLGIIRLPLWTPVCLLYTMQYWESHCRVKAKLNGFYIRIIGSIFRLHSTPGDSGSPLTRWYTLIPIRSRVP